jgi:DNA processing protein
MPDSQAVPVAHALRADDAAYPDSLHDLGARRPDPLHALGETPWPRGPMATVVGARAVTGYARRITERIVAALVGAGVGVASGMARGVDAAAHRAALDRGGFTVAVLGVGIDQVYPPEHADLYTRIARTGRVLSPWAAGEGVRRGRFPARNRVLAALGDVVVLVQADGRSGSRHTMRAALRLGRAVCVAPWPLGHPGYDGNAAWTREGVRVLTSFEDAARLACDARESRLRARPIAEETHDESARLLAATSRRAQSFEELARATGLDVGAAAAALLGLELRGEIERVGGDRYRRRNR